MRALLCSVIWIWCLVNWSTSSSATTAENIFKNTSRSIVLIKDLEGHGSGVALTSDGTILTSYHVVNSPFPLVVTADVSKGGMLTSLTFNEVKVLSVHKEYDLALISVKLPAGTSLYPLKRSNRALATGEECFVIGNPGGNAGEALRNSISTGIISASERMVEDRKFIQTTAAVNPGNSGGALVDRNGLLIGIIAFIISDTEGIGFAIPMKDLQNADFVKEKERKADLKKAIEYERIGAQWYERAKRCSGEARELALALAYMAFRGSLAENPTDPAPYNNLGTIYVDMEEFEKGKYCFRKAVELDGCQSPTYLKMLGICEMHSGNLEKAGELWKKGLLCKKDDIMRGECAENLAVTAIQTNLFQEAAYLIKWANSLAAARRPERAQVRSSVYQESLNKLNDDQFKYISDKNSDFSFEDMAVFKAGRINVASKPAAIVSDPAKSSKPAVSPKAIFEAALANAPEPGPEGLTKKIPESASDCQPAYGGVYLVLKFPEMKKLGIFNIAQMKFETYIPITNPDSIYACGGNTLLIFDPNEKLFHIYDMSSLERTGTKMSRIQGALTDINMGLLTSDKAVVSWADGTGALDRRHYGMLNIPSMQINPFESSSNNLGQGFRNTCYRDNVHIRLDPQICRFVSWCTSHSPCGFTCGTINGVAVSSHYEHSDFGSLSLMPDRARIVASAGKILDAKGSVRHDFKDREAILFAVDGANMVIKVSGKTASLVDAINLVEMETFPLPFSMKPISWSKDNLTTDKLAFASSYLNRVAFLDNSGLQIVVFKLAGKKQVSALSDQLAGVKAGTLWTRKLSLPAGTRLTIEDGPAGTKFDSNTMSLLWSIPAATPPGSYQILISVVEPEKEEVYQRISVTISD